MKIAVLDVYPIYPDASVWEWIAPYGEYTVYDRTLADETIARCLDADAVITNKVVFGEKEFAQLPRLKYIGVLATGYNTIDVEAAHRRGIIVTNIPAYSTHSVAQSIFAHLLNITNAVGHYAADNAHGRWTSSPDFCYHDTPLTELDGKVMGIVGFGRTGQATATLALAFGMRVLAYTSKPQEALPEGVTKATLDDVFSQADIVSLHCPLTAETRGLVNAQRLATMKPEAILINTSRGPVVDEQALADALNAGLIQAAGLDVLSQEPPKADCPLLTARNCYITPHIAWATREARQRLIKICQQNFDAFAQGKPINVV